VGGVNFFNNPRIIAWDSFFTPHAILRGIQFSQPTYYCVGFIFHTPRIIAWDSFFTPHALLRGIHFSQPTHYCVGFIFTTHTLLRGIHFSQPHALLRGIHFSQPTHYCVGFIFVNHISYTTLGQPRHLFLIVDHFSKFTWGRLFPDETTGMHDRFYNNDMSHH